MNVKFDEQTMRFLEEEVASGRFRSRSAVVREALRLQEEKDLKLQERPDTPQEPISKELTPG
ncbi:hypothetical protein BH09CHL1_BH09CHL1_01920 [soil metagenome]